MDAMGFFNATLGGLLGSAITSTVLAAVVLRWSKTVEARVKLEFDQRFSALQSTRAWKQQCLSELLGPLYMNFARTESAYKRWDKKNLFLEGQIVRVGNQTIRDTLLAKGHLIPQRLSRHATALILHYDVWMEAYDRIRGKESPSTDSAFVFVGPSGYPFPHEAEAAFKEEFERLQLELYGDTVGLTKETI